MNVMNSIFAKLLLSFFLLSIIPLLVSNWFTFMNAREEINEKLERETLNILDQKLKSLSFFIADAQRMADIIASHPAMSGYLNAPDDEHGKTYDAALDDLIASTHVIRPENIGVTILNGHGLSYSYGYEPVADMNLIREARWLKSETIPDPAGDTFSVSVMHDRPYSRQHADQQVFSVVRTIRHADASHFATVIIDFPVDVLREPLKNIFLIGGIYNDYASGIMLTDWEGQLLYPYPAGNFTDADFAHMGESYYLIHRHDKLTNWNYTAYFLKSELYKPIDATRNITLAIITVSIIVCQIASLIISSRISKPILHLRKLMGKVGRGDFNAHYPYEGRDEIGVLGKGFNTMVHRIQELIQLVYEEQNQKRRAEITAMQSQINPHFLYNTLESINSLARKNKQKDISRMIVLLGKLLRTSISTFDDLVPFSKELEYVRHYLEIHALRIKNHFSYSIEVDSQIKELYTLKWILQPVIENAVIHGIQTDRPESRIEIKGWQQGADIYISIRDYGVGMSRETVQALNFDLAHHAESLTKHGNKVGLFNVQSRLRLSFGERYGISAESEPGSGTTITFKLPRREQR